jgi:hypothetical protein
VDGVIFKVGVSVCAVIGRVLPGTPATARYVRVGLRDRSHLQMQPDDERIKGMRKSLLTLKSIKVFGNTITD